MTTLKAIIFSIGLLFSSLGICSKEIPFTSLPKGNVVEYRVIALCPVQIYPEVNNSQMILFSAYVDNISKMVEGAVFIIPGTMDTGILASTVVEEKHSSLIGNEAKILQYYVKYKKHNLSMYLNAENLSYIYFSRNDFKGDRVACEVIKILPKTPHYPKIIKN